MITRASVDISVMSQVRFCCVLIGTDCITHCINLFSGNEATLNFYLNNFTNVWSLEAAIRNIRYIGGNTNTTGGLWLMRTEIFNQANGDRQEVENVAILITDGNPTREVDKLDDEVRLIKASRIRILGVGVTNAVSFFSVCSLI